ncbi:MAG: phosphoribosyltransferase [Thermoplasmata archaeon]|nr:phosphoribosyltransferase [Thermoplasmata archaeon]
MAELPRCRLSTWSDADRWADTIAAAVRAADRVPGTIVGLTRGGWVPSRMLADRLGVKRLVSVRAQHWGVTATSDGKAELTEGLSGPVDGQDVLVVDDITDTGESLELAMAHVRARSPGRLESATFLHISHSKYRPTYYGEEIPRDAWAWIVFPWNYWEDLRTLAAQATAAGAADPAGVVTMLRDRCGLSTSVDDVTRAEAPIGPRRRR